ncbi:helix-turn-helix domain-containing protein [Bradyrhizobium sp. CCBAU 51753]|uniref:helix-turn-helix domain-containing protein n=1 Tax=Bradyrhizobium sp. CCBAU 51753 TaxID=1325100 RepID=UPI00188C6910|nr:helix-turn-helix transcriptional regulator [Bradyrhizobium sp. CCBAU 51753]QOZ23954.1 transcriptional regulator [Bradyrhizobium sp. CCBAU 51753]
MPDDTNLLVSSAWHTIDTTRPAVAWNVRRIRVDRGIPQERLAYDAGIDRSYVSGLERQLENPTIDLLDRIAGTLGVHLSDFFVQPPKEAAAPRILPKGRRPVRPRRSET